MAAARGLGKGLDALIPSGINEKSASSNKAKQDKSSEKQSGETMVNITKVEPNREQPRKNFDEDALEELAESIKQFGLLQPILVQDRKTYYEIIAGERRWRAAKKAGLKEVPVILDYGTRSMQISAVQFPYWENIARGWEDVEALVLLFQSVLLLIPAVIVFVFLFKKWKNRKWNRKDVWNFMMNVKDGMKLKIEGEKDRWQDF